MHTTYKLMVCHPASCIRLITCFGTLLLRVAVRTSIVSCAGVVAGKPHLAESSGLGFEQPHAAAVLQLVSALALPVVMLLSAMAAK